MKLVLIDLKLQTKVMVQIRLAALLFKKPNVKCFSNLSEVVKLVNCVAGHESGGNYEDSLVRWLSETKMQ